MYAIHALHNTVLGVDRQEKMCSIFAWYIYENSVPLTKSYAEWQRMAKEQPGVCRIWRFQDDPRKSDAESLRLEAEMSPVWKPGYDMRRPKE
jgi:hypothetical protein